MSTTKTPSKLKASISKKHIPSTTSSSRKPSAPKTAVDSKTNSPNHKVESPVQPSPSQFRDFSKLVSDSALEIHTAPDFNSSGMSLIEMLEIEGNKEGFQETQEFKLREEVISLRKDLAMKNNLVERLMRENSDLRREMEELLLTVEEAKVKLDVELQGSGDKIEELKERIKTLTAENKHYQDQIQSLTSDPAKKLNLGNLEEDTDNYYTATKERIDTFYMQLNEQIVEFMGLSKMHYENFNSLLLNRFDETKSSTAHHAQPAQTQEKSSPQSQEKTASQSQNANIKRPSTTRAVSTAHTAHTASSVGHIKARATIVVPNSVQTAITSDRGDRFNSAGTVNRRKKMMTLHNLGDIVPTNVSETNCATTVHATEPNMMKSPKCNFTPKPKAGFKF